MLLTSIHGLAAGHLTRVELAHRSADADRWMPAVADLKSIGLIETTAEGDSWTLRGDDLRLLELLARMDLQVRLIQSQDGQLWFAYLARVVAGGIEEENAFGKGFSPAQAFRGCLGEFAEHESWLFRPADSDLQSSSAALEKAGNPKAWTIDGEFWRAAGLAPCPPIRSLSIDWVRVQSMSAGSAEIMMPAFLCLGRYAAPPGIDIANLRGDTNGCAAGPDLPRAQVSALLELIERDATAIWWSGQYGRPCYSPVDDALLSSAIRGRCNDRSLWFLDLTTDLQIPVIAAISLAADGCDPALGVAARFDRGDAARAAYLELAQGELNLALLRYREREKRIHAASKADAVLSDWYAEINRNLPAHFRPIKALAADPTLNAFAPSSAGDRIDFLRERLQKAGIPIYWRDLTRHDIGIPVVRTIAPGVAHTGQSSRSSRLDSVPAALGWFKAEGATLNTPLPALRI